MGKSRTSTIRTPEPQVEMMELIARRDGVKPADAFREAMRVYGIDAIKDNPEIAEIATELAQGLLDERLEEAAAEIGNIFGEEILQQLNLPSHLDLPKTD